MNKMWQ